MKSKIVFCDEFDMLQEHPNYGYKGSKIKLPFDKFFRLLKENKFHSLDTYINWDVIFYCNISNQIINLVRNIRSSLPIYYYLDNKTIYISTNINSILKNLSSVPSPNPIWMSDYISMSHQSHIETFYQDIKRLPPGYVLQFNNGQLSVRQVLNYQIKSELRYKKYDDYLHHFAELLKSCVETAVKESHKIGIELSGGLDSASLAKLTQRTINAQNIFTYSHAQDKSFLYKKVNDERITIKETLSILNLNQHQHRFITRKGKGMKSLFQEAINIGNGVAASHFTTSSLDSYKAMKQDSLTTVLSGWGGDYCVSHRITARQFQYNFLKKIKHTAFILQLRRLLLKQPPLRGYEMENTKEMVSQLKEMFPEIKNIDTINRWAAFPKRNKKYTNIRELLFHWVQDNPVIQRIESTHHATFPLGIKYNYPMLHPMLVEFILSLPNNILLPKQQSRKLFKDTISLFLPDKIAKRDKVPASMYGWALDSYYYDYINNTSFLDKNYTYEQYFCKTVEELKDKLTYQNFK